MANISIHNQTLTSGSDDDDSFVLLPAKSSDTVDNTMMGGLGNDYYEVDGSDSVVLENAKGGIDTVQLVGNITNQEFTLYSNVENVIIAASSNAKYVYGNNENNVIAAENSSLVLNTNLYGGAGNDTLLGDAGINHLNGGTGNDTMRGYDGNDDYIVDSVGDKVIEDSATGGIDAIYSNVTYTLGKNVENLLLQGSSNINGTGNELDNNITGNSGNNILSGGAGNDDLLDSHGGNDILDGGSGDDRLKVEYGTGTLLGGSGNDTLEGGDGNDRFDGGIGDDVVLAGHGDNVAYGGQGNDQLHTGSGSDQIYGGAGNDILIDWNDVQPDQPIGNVLRGGDGNDLIVAEMSGNRGWGNTLEGGNGNDILVDNAGSYYNTNGQGISKADVLNGGAGNDQYYLRISSGLDKIQIIDTSGYETVHLGGAILTQNTTPTYGNLNLGSNILDHLQFTLAAGLENVDASQANGASYLVGNSSNNLMIGSDTTDVIIAGAGNDTLDGRGGADNLLGGSGDDTYIISDSNDTVVEEASAGIDTVIANVNHRLTSNVENLRLIGTAGIGIGNALNNTIEGNQGQNRIEGGDGNDVLSGGTDTAGDVLWGGNGNDVLYGSINDALYGGKGDDVYYVRSVGEISELNDEGIDSVISYGSFWLEANLENLTLVSGTENWDAFGNDTQNYIKANDGYNKLYDDANGTGFNDQDTLEGGKGSDEYYIGWDIDGTKRDKIIELAGGGNDLVNLAVNGLTRTLNLTLGSGDLNQIEHLNVWGSKLDTYSSNSLAFNILGSVLDNKIFGSTKNDRMDGGAGNDRLAAAEGNDTLFGGAGNDTLEGGQGTDWLEGGAGNDVYYLDGNDTLKESTLASGGIDTIYSVDLNVDLKSVYKGVEHAFGEAQTRYVTLTGSDAANTLGGKQFASNILEMIGGSGNDTYIIQGASDLSKVRIVETGTSTTGDFDTVISHVLSYTLANNVEKLILAGTATYGYGNSRNNTLLGNNANNYLDGGEGNDRLEGGAGDDNYIVDSTEDMVVEAADGGHDGVFIVANGTFTLAANVEDGGILDQALASAHLVGNSLDNMLEGNGQDNFLTGAAGNDSLYGNSGNDHLDGGSGNDQLYGGNGTDNLFGGAGNDLLDGGIGTDRMEGGVGNDVYFIDSAADIVAENANEGIDIVSVVNTATSLSYTLATNVENLYANNNAVALTLIGNDLANTLAGNNQANFIDGGKGADVLMGGGGNDTYWVDTTADLIIDIGNDSADLIIAKGISFNLASNGIGIEKLTLDNGTLKVTGIGNNLGNTIIVTGSGSATLDGGGGDDTLNGNSGFDTLIGGAGNDILDGSTNRDILTGGLGNDTFHFHVASATDADVITDYTFGQDHIRLDKTFFSAVLDTDANKILDASDFLGSYTGGVWSNAHIAYDQGRGELWYSAQGNGLDKMLIAILGDGPHPTLTNADILLM